jgi:hypothetical protein
MGPTAVDARIRRKGVASFNFEENPTHEALAALREIGQRMEDEATEDPRR